MAIDHGHFEEVVNWQCEVVVQSDIAILKHHELALTTHNNNMFMFMLMMLRGWNKKMLLLCDRVHDPFHSGVEN